MICKKCGQDLPEEKFSIIKATSTYTRKSDGVTMHYYHEARRKTCIRCIYLIYRKGFQQKYRNKPKDTITAY